MNELAIAILEAAKAQLEAQKKLTQFTIIVDNAYATFMATFASEIDDKIAAINAEITRLTP